MSQPKWTLTKDAGNAKNQFLECEGRPVAAILASAHTADVEALIAGLTPPEPVTDAKPAKGGKSKG